MKGKLEVNSVWITELNFEST